MPSRAKHLWSVSHTQAVVRPISCCTNYSLNVGTASCKFLMQHFFQIHHPPVGEGGTSIFLHNYKVLPVIKIKYSMACYQCRFYLGLFQSPGRQKKARQAKHTDLGYAASQHALLQLNHSSTVRLGPFPYSQASFTNYTFSRKPCTNFKKPLANHNSFFTVI